MVPTDSPLKISSYRSTVQSLPVTSLGLATVLLSGFFGILLTDPVQEVTGIPAGLSRVSAAFSLIQAFQGDSGRPAPQLWNQRLGLTRAADLWRRQGRSVWWQGWSEDGDAYLILPDHLIADNTKNLRKHQVLGLTMLGSDELHRQQLIERLKHQPELPAQPNSLQNRCMQRLAKAPAVYWTGDALAVISGTMAPLLQQARYGCLALRLSGNKLIWGGIVGDRSLAVAAVQPKKGWIISASHRQMPSDLDQTSLMEVHGERVDLMLGTLLNRQIIQQPLESLYGVDQSVRAELANAPFSLRLEQQEQGSYRAGLQFQAPLPGGAATWGSVLNRVSQRLKERGFQLQKPSQVKGQPGSTKIWTDNHDGKSRIVGGWRWLQQSNHPELLSAGLAILPEKKPFYHKIPAPDHSVLLFNARPRGLSSLGLMSGSWPALLKQADSLTVRIKPAIASLDPSARRQQSWWEIRGQLVLTSEGASSEPATSEASD